MQGKLFTRLFILISAMIFLTACDGMDKNQKDFINKLKNVNSYSCNVAAKIKNNKSVMKYELKNFYKKNIGFRIEVLKPEELTGQISIYKNNEFYSYNPDTKKWLTIEATNNTLSTQRMIGSFIHYLNNSENLKSKEEQWETYDCYTYQIKLGSSNAYLKEAKLYLNKKNGLPVKLEMTGENGDITVEIVYTEFKICKLESSLFEIN